MNKLDTKDAVEILLSEKKKADVKLEKAYDSYCLFPNEKDQTDWDTYSALSTALDMAISALQAQENLQPNLQPVATDNIKQFPSITQKQDGWIPCSERLPEEPTEVMHELEMYSEYNVVIEGFTIPTTLCYAGDGEWRREESYYNVEKWQPLPKP